MIPVRADVPKEHQWNVEAIYHTTDEWQKSFLHYKGQDASPRWPELVEYKGKLGEGPLLLADALKIYFNIDRILSKLYTYSHLRHDEDLANELNKKNYSSMLGIFHDFQMETSWMEPELLQMSEADFHHLIQSDQLKEYRFYLEKIWRMREHTLSEKEERLLSLSGKPLETVSKAFSSLNNADLQFAPIKDQKGNEHPLSHGLYHFYLKSPDRTLRKNAYESMHKSYLSFENTLCELIAGQVENHLYLAKARHYKSALESALFPHKVDLSVYTNLIQTVRKHLGSLHKYVKLRKKIMGLQELRAYDLYAPLVEEQQISIDYEEGRNLVLEAMKPLGTSYCEILRKGLFEERWVDVFENKKKRSGAYSSGCYDTFPYILMNYNATLNDVFTLAHEMGHSMHSYLSNENQPYPYSRYPIFVAEVASTFNEQLLLRLLLEKSQGDKKRRTFLINHAIDGIRGTLFRQTLFAEFELKIHEWAEKGVPLTPRFLKDEFTKLYQDYYGPELILDEQVAIEWSRIPHFYYNFYVYQYATGISAALALVQGVDNPKKREHYLQFLSSGGSRYPLDLLKLAGVDMRSPEPIDAALTHFAKLVDELEGLLR